jgi:hypothetical protein
MERRWDESHLLLFVIHQRRRKSVFVFLLRGEERKRENAYVVFYCWYCKRKILGWATYKKKIGPELVWLLPYPAVLRSAPASHGIRQVYHMKDNDVWLQIWSLFRIGSLAIWILNIYFVLYHSNKVLLMQEGLVSSHAIKQMCHTQDIVMSKLSLYHYLGFDYLFWLISFKTSTYHSRRFGFISCNQTNVSNARY